jgi:hypothetical protein
MAKFDGYVFALDLATTTGWAWGQAGSTPLFGHERFAKPGESRAKAYHQFRLFLDLFYSARQCNVIVFESPAVPSFLGGKTNIETTKLLFGLCENLEHWAYERHADLREASISQIRSHFIGRNLQSKIAKPLVLAKCRERGWNAATTDESDALALWDYQICCLRPDLGIASTPLFDR